MHRSVVHFPTRPIVHHTTIYNQHCCCQHHNTGFGGGWGFASTIFSGIGMMMPMFMGLFGGFGGFSNPYAFLNAHTQGTTGGSSTTTTTTGDGGDGTTTTTTTTGDGGDGTTTTTTTGDGGDGTTTTTTTGDGGDGTTTTTTTQTQITEAQLKDPKFRAHDMFDGNDNDNKHDIFAKDAENITITKKDGDKITEFTIRTKEGHDYTFKYNASNGYYECTDANGKLHQYKFNETTGRLEQTAEMLGSGGKRVATQKSQATQAESQTKSAPASTEKVESGYVYNELKKNGLLDYDNGIDIDMAAQTIKYKDKNGIEHNEKLTKETLADAIAARKEVETEKAKDTRAWSAQEDPGFGEDQQFISAKGRTFEIVCDDVFNSHLNTAKFDQSELQRGNIRFRSTKYRVKEIVDTKTNQTYPVTTKNIPGTTITEFYVTVDGQEMKLEEFLQNN